MRNCFQLGQVFIFLSFLESRKRFYGDRKVILRPALSSFTHRKHQIVSNPHKNNDRNAIKTFCSLRFFACLNNWIPFMSFYDCRTYVSFPKTKKKSWWKICRSDCKGKFRICLCVLSWSSMCWNIFGTSFDADVNKLPFKICVKKLWKVSLLIRFCLPSRQSF